MPSRKTSQWYRKIYRHGSVVRSPNLQIYHLKRGQGGFELGVVVPNSVVLLATQRNLVKRRIVSVFRQQGILAGYDCVVSVKRNISKMPMKALVEEIMKSLSQKRL